MGQVAPGALGLAVAHTTLRQGDSAHHRIDPLQRVQDPEERRCRVELLAVTATLTMHVASGDCVPSRDPE